MKKKILAVFFVVIIILTFTVSAAAITPPIATTDKSVFGGSSNLTEADADAVENYIKCMHDLNYFQFGDFVLVGRLGSTTRMYVVAYGTCSVNSDGNSTVLSISYPGLLVGYNFVADGVRVNEYQVSGGDVYSFSNENILLTVNEGVITRNESYSYGTVTSAAFQTTSALWSEFYEKVYNYDANINDAESQGRADGYEDGYSAGYDVGEDIGYEAGYDDGYSDAEAEYQDEYQNGFEAGKTEGVSEGYETGYNVGYNEGQDNGYALGLTDGRLEGYENGYADGYDDGIAEGGGSGSDLIPFELSFYLEVPINVDNSGIITYKDYLLTWKNEDPETLGFRDPDDEDEGQLAGFFAYHITAYFAQEQINDPTSVFFTIPSEILTLVPTAEFGSITFDPYEVIDGTRVADVYLIYDQYFLGYNNGLQDADAIVNSLGAVASAPVSGLAQALDFEIFGLNVGVVLIGIIAVVLIFLAWKLFKKFIPV